MVERRVVRQPTCLWRQGLDGVLVLAPGSDAPVHIGGSGAVAWLLLAEPTTVTDLITAVAELFGVETREVGTDVTRLVDELLEAGLIEIVPDQPEAST